jgi:hypothetical protein
MKHTIKATIKAIYELFTIEFWIEAETDDGKKSKARLRINLMQLAFQIAIAALLVFVGSVIIKALFGG